MKEAIDMPPAPRTPGPGGAAAPPGRVARALAAVPLTREGMFWGAIATGMLVTGLAKGINLITLLACLLLVMVLWNYLLAKRQFAGMRARRLDADPPFAGAPWRWRVHLTNLGRRPVHALRVQAGDD